MITAKQVKELRDRTGVGMMECKKALSETGGDIEKAYELLRKKGAATASKKSSRAAREGIIESYVHLGGRIGVLIEVNCETDFVARTDELKDLAHNLAMQVAAARPLYVSREDVPADDVEAEKRLQRDRALEEGKPEGVVERMVEGRMDKYFQEICLLEQPFIREPERKVRDLITEAVTRTGENITVGKFARFEIGEGN